MGSIRIGDIVARKSYGTDILFKVADIIADGKENVITLKGINYRIQADAPESDLILQSEQRVREDNVKMTRIAEEKCRSNMMCSRRSVLKKSSFRNTPKDSIKGFSRPGKILHIDGDSSYLDTCLKKYKEFGIDAVGRNISEKEQPSSVYKLLQEHKPDILILTGHDGVTKGSTNYSNPDIYKNSRYFINAVKEARRYNSSLDDLVIFAGACQSMYYDIIDAGSNYASSPYRVLIQALDPVLVGQKVALTGIGKILNPIDVIDSTITGVKGIGGVQTIGKYRDGFPFEPYNN